MEFIKVITEPWNEEENDKQGFCMDNWHVLITIYTNVPDGFHEDFSEIPHHPFLPFSCL